MVDIQADIRYTFYEISEILRHLPKEYNEKLPKNLKKLISENKISNGFTYDKDKTLDKQEMLPDTKVLLSILYRTYWCSEEKRRKLEEEDNKILNEKYSYDNLFKEKNEADISNKEESNYLEIVQEKWYQKIIKVIKKILRRDR